MGISDVLSSPSGKRISGMAYGLGASVVIIGALFKIMHWPFAGVLLSIGMFTEALLFALSAVEKPHKEWEWSLVYPELEGGQEKELKGKKETKLPQIDTASLVEIEMKKLSEGVHRLNETAGQLGTLSSAASISDAYVNNLSKASDAASAFAASQKNLKDSSDSLVSSYQDIATSIGSASHGSKNFASQMDGINKNVTTISSVFELQAKSVAEQNEAMKALVHAIAKMETSLSGSAKEAEDYKHQVATLAQQMKSLNAVYGNMLNAMTIRG
ncbi:MAG: gliding motility protein GldL [Prevotellaceae bacterium]|jgi:gliding motility-associated protein GldL|nr:gliding motility protein GldL [Prevotellaceae bacterium]